MNSKYAISVDRCVVCGELIPEGRQICLNCEHSHPGPNRYPAINAPTVFGRFRYWVSHFQTRS